ncbi:MAG TPA: hypothetical protein VN817_03375 [Solirubrobacteraceae bacterium]|nr:hypothetical protein [Solirubrobacteraceae bacterium]
MKVTRASSLAFVVCAVLVTSLSVVEASASAEGLPKIVDAQAKDMTEHGATLELQIDPQGSETAYEVWLECERAVPGDGPCEPPLGGAHEQGGQIAADVGVRSVVVDMTSLPPDRAYLYRVAATNASGRVEEPFQLQFETVPLGSCSGGCPYRASISLADYESAERTGQMIYEEAEAARHRAAHEHEEQTAREQAARYAAEAAALSRRHEEESAAAAVAPRIRCVVPSLRGDTLPAARRALEKAHCSLGKVHRPRHRTGVLRVVAQSVAHSRSLAAGVAVAVTLGRERAQLSHDG